MRDPKKYAMACACHWLNRCYDYGFTAEEVVARSVFRQMVSKRLDTQRDRDRGDRPRKACAKQVRKLGKCAIMLGDNELSTLSTLSTFELKKAEMKKRHSPQTPYREKAKGKEFSRYACSTDYRGRAGACVRSACVAGAGAKRGVAALVAAAVEEALTAFGGTRGPKPSDEALWAAIAWRIGAENFHHAVLEKISENDADGCPRNPAAAFQRFLNNRHPNGGAR